MAAQMHAVPKVIGSITLDRADWQNPALIRGDAAAEITGSKQQSGKNIAISGPAMAAGGCARPAGRARSTAGELARERAAHAATPGRSAIE